MMTWVLRLVLLTFTVPVLAVAACGAGGANPAGSVTPSVILPTATPSALPAPTPVVSLMPPAGTPSGARIIATADDNRAVTVGVGDYLTVALDSDFDWSNVEVSDATVL